MNIHRARVIGQAWDDFEMGYCTRRQAEAVETYIHHEQQLERERLGDQKVIVDCYRCGVPIELPALAYRGANRHACADCLGGGTSGWSGWPRMLDEEAS